MSALRAAALQGNESEVHRLLDTGVAAGEPDMSGFTALMLAAKYGKVAVIRLLLEAGANPDWTHDYGGTALNEATMIRDVVAVRELLRGGANPQIALNAPNPVYRMGIRRNPEILALLETAAKTRDGERKGTIREEQDQ